MLGNCKKNPKNGSVLRGKNIFGRSFLPDKNRPSETPKRSASSKLKEEEWEKLSHAESEEIIMQEKKYL